MLWWVIGFFVAVVALRGVAEWRNGPRPPSRWSKSKPLVSSRAMKIEDLRLGVLEYDPNAKCWRCRVTLDDGVEIELSMKGDRGGPDNAALEAAHRLVGRGVQLVDSIKGLVVAATPSEKLAKNPLFASERAEMLSLVVDAIHIRDAGPPLSCMVFFKEDPAHTGLWRCEYDGERVFDFGVDT